MQFLQSYNQDFAKGRHVRRKCYGRVILPLLFEEATLNETANVFVPFIVIDLTQLLLMAPYLKFVVVKLAELSVLHFLC